MSIELRARLAELRAEPSHARALLLAHELSEALPYADGESRARFVEALAELRETKGWGFPWRELAPVPLEAGGTWILVVDSAGRGHVLRARVYRETVARDTRLQVEVARAQRSVLATLARAQRRLDAAPFSLDCELPEGGALSGGSLGLAVAIGVLSSLLGRPPLSGVAASARVTENGELLDVEHIDAKLEALRRGWPQVEQLVVARGQALPGWAHDRYHVIAASSLGEAIPHFGINLDDFPMVTPADYLERLARFQNENDLLHGALRWRELSNEARAIGAALAVDDLEASVRSLLWAARFSIHAGYPDDAQRLVESVPIAARNRFPDLDVLHRITCATSEIDVVPARAVSLAEESVVRCRQLEPRYRDELLGRALGTHGRALLHAGQARAAEPLLREAYAHHHVHKPRESPRSACYLATCLRLAGRAREGVEVIAAARREIAQSRWPGPATTRFFLELEAARTYLSLGEWLEAERLFELVRSERWDVEYFRMSAERGLAVVRRKLGRFAEAEQSLRHCLGLARSDTSLLGKTAALAAGEALLDASECGVERTELEAVWQAAYGMGVNPPSVAVVVRDAVY